MEFYPRSTTSRKPTPSRNKDIKNISFFSTKICILRLILDDLAQTARLFHEKYTTASTIVTFVVLF